ncbi:MAG: hypothetical protein ACJ74Y_01880 [Bryobacteraceae bacterium]
MYPFAFYIAPSKAPLAELLLVLIMPVQGYETNGPAGNAAANGMVLTTVTSPFRRA